MEAVMTVRVSASLFLSTLGLIIPYAASAEEFVMCNTDYIGCQSHVQISCAELRTGTTIGAAQRKAAEFCTSRGYHGGQAIQIGKSGDGGECGTYKFRVICQ